MPVAWKAVSDSAWHHPGVAFGLSALALVVVLRRVPPGPLRRALLFFTALTALDAFFTGALSPLPAHLAQSASIAFVILGDLRLFALLERFRRRSRWAPAFMRGAALSFVVPVSQAIAITSAPSTFTDLRRIYLVYELLFVALAVGLLALRYPSKNEESPELGWYATSLLTYFLVQYVLWVICDVLILTGADFGYGLRLVPNALYYGLFVIFAALRAPAEATS